jgi:hypothetical protein
MDRHADGPAAFDLDYQRLPSWCQLEAELANPGWTSSTTSGAGSLATATELVRVIRNQAVQVWDKPRGSATADCFRPQYLSALLYHTLRAIAYKLSPFKRLLAVDSAARLIRVLSGV